MTKTKEQIEKENDEFEQLLNTKVETKGADMAVMMVEQKDRSINFGVVGVGQAGSRIAEEFHNRGYNVLAINSALQDLKYINISEKQKLFLDVGIGGAGKDINFGRAAVEDHADSIFKVLQDNFEDSEIMLLAISGGGGTGSGGSVPMAKLLAQFNKPLVVIYILPLSSEDTLAKHNSIQTLAELAKLAKEDVINSLVVVDNAKIELLKPGISMAEFWKFANSSIVEPLHLFNKLSSQPSAYTSLDPSDLSQVLIGTGDCALYGMIEIENFLDDDAIAEAIITNVKNGLLASDFDLTQTRSAGIIVTGSKKVLQLLPSSNLEYGLAMVNKICNEGTRIFRGVYELENGHPDVLRVYSFFSGLGLPEERVKELKAEAERHMEILKNKENNRSSAMTIDMGKTTTISAADVMHKKIQQKYSAMGKLNSNSKKIIDRRR